jgi:tRNA(Ile)-lysidine synthase
VSVEEAGEPARRQFPRVCAVHINHKIRQTDADNDEQLVRRYCEQRGIPFFSKTVDVPGLAIKSGRGLEETGRDVRRAYFQEVSGQFVAAGDSPVFTAVAHHREDAAETFMMNLFRGTGPDGLSGMPPKSGNLVRPLLFASKSEIMHYLTQNKVPFAEDVTNSDNTYLRNYFRNEIFPRLGTACRKDPVQPILVAAEIFRRDKEYFDQVVGYFFDKYQVIRGSKIGLPCGVFRKEPLSISSRLIRYLFVQTFGDAKNLSEAHCTAILQLVSSMSGGGSISLPGNRNAFINDDTLFFSENLQPNLIPFFGRDLLSENMRLMDCPGDEEIRISFDPEGGLLRTVIPNSSLLLETIVVENPDQVVYNGQAWYCTAKELDGAVIRTRREGDRISPAGSSGSKLFRRYLTDRKVPLPVRDHILIAARESNVLWVPGLVHAVGFTDTVSHERYIFSRGHEDKDQQSPSVLVRVSLIQGRIEREERSTWHIE